MASCLEQVVGRRRFHSMLVFHLLVDCWSLRNGPQWAAGHLFWSSKVLSPRDRGAQVFGVHHQPDCRHLPSCDCPLLPSWLVLVSGLGHHPRQNSWYVTNPLKALNQTCNWWCKHVDEMTGYYKSWKKNNLENGQEDLPHVINSTGFNIKEEPRYWDRSFYLTFPFLTLWYIRVVIEDCNYFITITLSSCSCGCLR